MFYRCLIALDLRVQLPISVQNNLSQSLIVGEEPVCSDKTDQLHALDSSLVAKQLLGSLIETVLCRSPRLGKPLTRFIEHGCQQIVIRYLPLGPPDLLIPSFPQVRGVPN